MQETDEKKIERHQLQVLKEIGEEFTRISKLGAALTEDDKAFIRARASYLTPSQKEFWADVLAPKTLKSGTEDKKQASYKQLQARATELGIKAVGVTRDELEKLVTEAEAGN